jgi:hypothetical protein
MNKAHKIYKGVENTHDLQLHNYNNYKIDYY